MLISVPVLKQDFQIFFFIEWLFVAGSMYNLNYVQQRCSRYMRHRQRCNGYSTCSRGVLHMKQARNAQKMQ